MTSPSRPLFGVVGAALSLGCYTYVPASLDVVPVGAEVRALLSTDAELALRDSLGVPLHPLRGTLVDRQDGRLLLSVRAGIGSRGLGSQPLYQRIGVTPQDVLRVEVRRLQRTRTMAFAVAVAGVATLVTLGALGKLNPGGSNSGGGGPPE